MTMENICAKCFIDIDPSEEQLCFSCREEEFEEYEELVKKIEGVLELVVIWKDNIPPYELAPTALKNIRRHIKEFREKNNG